MGEGNINARAGTPALAGRWNPSLASSECLANGICKGRGQEGIALLVFAVHAHQGCLAIALDGGIAEGSLKAAAKLLSEMGRLRDDSVKRLDELAGLRISNGGGNDQFVDGFSVREAPALEGLGLLAELEPLADVKTMKIGGIL